MAALYPSPSTSANNSRNGNSKPGQHVAAGQHVVLAENRALLGRSVDGGRPGARIDVPHQTHAGGEVIDQLPPHFAFRVALGKHFDRQVRRDGGNRRLAAACRREIVPNSESTRREFALGGAESRAFHPAPGQCPICVSARICAKTRQSPSPAPIPYSPSSSPPTRRRPTRRSGRQWSIRSSTSCSVAVPGVGTRRMRFSGTSPSRSQRSATVVQTIGGEESATVDIDNILGLKDAVETE